jgi:hypothetical protein
LSSLFSILLMISIVFLSLSVAYFESVFAW